MLLWWSQKSNDVETDFGNCCQRSIVIFSYNVIDCFDGSSCSQTYEEGLILPIKLYLSHPMSAVHDLAWRYKPI